MRFLSSRLITSYNISIAKSTVFCFFPPCGCWPARVAQFAWKRVQWMPKTITHQIADQQKLRNSLGRGCNGCPRRLHTKLLTSKSCAIRLEEGAMDAQDDYQKGVRNNLLSGKKTADCLEIPATS